MDISPVNEKNAYQSGLFRKRLVKRYKHLKKWAKRCGIEAYRLYDRDIPEIPLVLDLYGDAAAGALYERPYEKEPQEEERWLALMKEAAAEALGLPPAHIFIKRRRRQRGSGQYERAGRQGFIRDIGEGGLRFRVNLSDFIDTGLFLDHRRTRARLRAEAAGKKVLNLFCYTASFSVYAAAGGAAEIDSLDLSHTYLDWAKTNFALNGFKSGGAFRFIRSDVLVFLQEAREKKRRWDLIVLDPPGFSNSKKMRAVLDLKRDYIALARSALDLLNPGGSVYFSANTRRFSFDRAAFPGVHIEEFPLDEMDEDFLHKKVPACYILFT